jgi:hypothetical protein
MRNARAALAALSMLAGCANLRFQPYVGFLARSEMCCPTATVQQLRGWAFKVEGCGQTVYWRCSTGSDGDCCWPVPTERAATRVLGLGHPEREVCRDDVEGGGG